VNVLVKNLEQCGLLRRSRHPSHGRILLASLTPPGRRALKKGRAVGLDVQGRLLSRVSAADQRKLMRLLKAIEQVSAE
jgi:DNA-binding MarR family transcriptional regulator